MASSTRLPASQLYLFQLPTDLVNHLTPRQLVIPTDHPLHPSNRQSNPIPIPNPDLDLDLDLDLDGKRPRTGAYTCALTGASFDSLHELKQHYRTDWYRYNVKLKLQGKPTPVSEQAFNQLVEDLSDSISGSDTSSSSSFSDSDSSSPSSSSPFPTSSTDASLSRLLAKQSLSRSPADVDAEQDLDSTLLSGPKSPLQWFDAPRTPEGLETQYGIHRAALPAAGARKRLLPSSEEGASVLAELKALQLPDKPREEEDEEKKWTMLMFGGGHFAGWVISLRPRMVSTGKGGKAKEREVVVLESKTFHRYTTRRKQGGGQGANDAANGKAKSAGAQIRRHNEAMLNDEVGALLTSWSHHLHTSSLIFLRASKSSHKTFFFPSSPLTRTDPRIRGFGFPTKRPTLSELGRCWAELTRVKVGHLTRDELEALDREYLKSIAPPPPVAAKKDERKEKDKEEKVDDVPKLTKKEELVRDRWTRLVEMVRKGRLDSTLTFLSKYGDELALSPSPSPSPSADDWWGVLPEWMPESRASPTLLHLAAAAGQPALVRLFLDPPFNACPYPYPPPDPSSPPCAASTSKAAYDLSTNRPTRNEFRFASHREPTKWDWSRTGRVPSALDEEVERERERREEEKRTRLREREREREREKEKEREEREERRREEEDGMRDKAIELAASSAAGASGPKRLGGGPPQPVRERERAGLTEEQRIRVMREERARAAEARLKRLGS
ncbi:C2H2 finger and ankyrin domain protein [Rhodotorula toruloides]|uniref:C2H2 finger and ankyrin domain protein n=1 Tax=Rhodotorula toruloides TaxID=5286 RepID=A0A511KRD9_RHOTO|nr:C2H2 finger and ankyrin domain protein [Rhodotorula toruloides]